MASSADRAAYVIYTDDVERTADFYTALGPFERCRSSDWYAVVRSPQEPTVELGIVDRNSRIVPFETFGRPQAGYLSLVVADVEEFRSRAKKAGADVLSPKGLFGQTRLMLRDPNGVLLELSSPDALAAIA